jgi:hypothetical protein
MMMGKVSITIGDTPPSTRWNKYKQQRVSEIMADSVWKNLSGINCTEHTAKKGQFSYLSWTWAWAMVKEHYPLADYELEPDVVFPDGTMEVRVSVSIEGMTHTMWLPVLDHKNKAVNNPNAFDINSSRMRCLVKCLAMFGLGHYIYAGESVPQERVVEETKVMIKAGAQINACFESDDLPGAAQLWDEWDYEEMMLIARAPSKGGQLSTQSREKMKSTEFRMALNEVRGITMDEET